MKYLDNINELEKLNSSVWVLTQKVKNIHFNMRGKEFYSLHLLTDKLYAELEEEYDLLSEKIAMSGHVVKASFTEHVSNSVVEDTPGKAWTYEEAINTVVSDLDKLLDLTNKMSDLGIITLQPALDEVTMTADKYKWLFKSHK